MNTYQTQLTLFDDSGASPFDFDRDSTLSWSDNADIEAEGMHFKFCCDIEQQEALEIVFDGLREIHLLEPNHLDNWLESGRGMELNTWEMRSFAAVRDSLDDGVIRIHNLPKALAISLPHPDLWDENGLLWLREFQPCCLQNRKNPTPWLAPTCGCTPCQ